MHASRSGSYILLCIAGCLQYAIVGSKQDAEKAAELWRFGPKAFKQYYNVRDPEEIEREANSEIPLEQVYGDWPVGTDPNVHLETVNELFESGGVALIN